MTVQPEPLLTTDQLCGYLGISRVTLYKWRKKGLEPPYFFLSPSVRRFRLSEVEAWLAERRRGGLGGR